MKELKNLERNIIFYLLDNSATETEIYRDFRKYRKSVVKHCLNKLEKDGDVFRHDYRGTGIYSAIKREQEMQ